MQGEDWQLGESLDGFDDLLYGGFGAAKDLKSYKIVWENSSVSREKLGKETTKSWCLQKLKNPQFNQKLIASSLRELDTDNGKTYFEMLIDIIRSHQNIKLELR